MITAVAAAVSTADQPIRVMIVDDAVVVRRQLTRWIDAETDITVAAASHRARSGRADGSQQSRRRRPRRGHAGARRHFGAAAAAQKKRDLVVIMASALTRRSAEVSLRALSLGAADYVPKPETATDAATSAAFQRELIEKIRSLGGRGRAPDGQRRPSQPAKTA